jgi:hypothetical protein
VIAAARTTTRMKKDGDRKPDPPVAVFIGWEEIMGTLMTLLGLVFAGVVCLAVLALAATLVKFSIEVVLIPLKLLLLPIVAVVVVVKAAVLISLISVALLLLIPIAVVIGVIVAPFALIGAALC